MSVFSSFVSMIEKIKKYKFIYDSIVFVYKLPQTIYYYTFLLIFSIFRIDNKKIVIVNFEGKGYWDNGKYICNELIKYNYNIYWATKEEYRGSLPKKVNYVKFNSIKYLYHLATSKIWINNSRFPFWIRKRTKQFYIQTWHGPIGFKKCEAAAIEVLSRYYVCGAKNDSKMANLFISNSTFCTNNYKNNFWYNGKILECGCPRNDIIINNSNDIVNNVKKYFWFQNLEKICLYAPTFRDNKSLNAYDIEYKRLLDKLKNKFTGNRKLLIRLHPAISNLTDKLSIFNENIINASDYPDMQELLVAADFMITDYSSCIFDYAISRKPAIIYASDIEEYNNKDRDFLFKIEDTPFSISTDNEELRNMIENFDIDEYNVKVGNFYNKMWLKETGGSCEKIVEIINKISK